MKLNKSIESIINNAEGKKIAVIGDMMLDRYFWGTVTRVSPEAPVPVVDLEDETWHLGGAANVAQNLKTLGMQPIIFGVIGNDKNGIIFKELAEQNAILTNGLYVDNSRPTTVKMRIIGNNQQISRLDKESRADLDEIGKEFLINTLKNIESLAGIIFEDYNKGVVSKKIIYEIITYANNNNIPIFVDPKFNNFFEYSNVTMFKPNRKEASAALGYDLKNSDDIIKGAKEINSLLNCQSTLITLGSDGMMLLENGQEAFFEKAKAKNVADVSGAGDTCIATFAMAFVGGADLRESTIISNYASSTVVSEPGIIAIDKNTLINIFNETN